MSTLASFKDQSFFIPAPTLTEQNLPSQAGRVFIVTGGYAGVGLELVKILYAHDGTIYVAGRSESKAAAAIDAVKTAFPASKGRLEFLHVDLADLATIKPAAQAFLAKESRLDVLTNNAGVMVPPKGSTSAQGHELQMATNVLGPFLFTQQLLPLLQKTAASSPPGSVRVTWAASVVVDLVSPKGGVVFDPATSAPVVHADQNANYGQSKAANVFLASELARRHPLSAASRLVSNSWNPGNLRSELQRHMGWLQQKLTNAMCHDAVYGAYTELFAGWSEDAGKPESNGRFIAPWGRFRVPRADVEEGRRSKADGGSGVAEALWEWCERETKAFA